MRCDYAKLCRMDNHRGRVNVLYMFPLSLGILLSQGGATRYMPELRKRDDREEKHKRL